MKSDWAKILFILIGLTVGIPILVVNAITLVRGCPEGQVMIKGVVGYVCVRQ